MYMVEIQFKNKKEKITIKTDFWVKEALKIIYLLHNCTKMQKPTYQVLESAIYLGTGAFPNQCKSLATNDLYSAIDYLIRNKIVYKHKEEIYSLNPNIQKISVDDDREAWRSLWFNP